MKRLLALMAGALAISAAADPNPLCDVALAALERYALARGINAQARCRATAVSAPAEGAYLTAADWPKGQPPRSGALTWPVRVQRGDARHYVQQVPLTVAWSGPAWVATRSLDAGRVIQPGDLELQLSRWPEGQTVQLVDVKAYPAGRTRNALRAGDMLLPTALLPTDELMRGDAVTAVLSQGAMEIRIPAQLVSASRIGTRARVQAAGRTTALEGRLVDTQTVLVSE